MYFGQEGELGGLEGGFGDEFEVLLLLISYQLLLGRQGIRGEMRRLWTYSCSLQHLSQAWEIIDALVESADGGGESPDCFSQGGDAALE